MKIACVLLFVVSSLCANAQTYFNKRYTFGNNKEAGGHILVEDDGYVLLIETIDSLFVRYIGILTIDNQGCEVVKKNRGSEFYIWIWFNRIFY